MTRNEIRRELIVEIIRELDQPFERSLTGEEIVRMLRLCLDVNDLSPLRHGAAKKLDG